MSGTLFKLTKSPDGLTRRVLFDPKPSWEQLADKIESLYGIPKDNVGVSYVDTDGDEVTLSSDDELQDYYSFSLPVKGFGQAGDVLKAIRFTVRDLSATRESDKPLPQTPHTNSAIGNNRNTFGTSNVFPTGFESSEDWQHISSYPGGLPQSIFIPIVPEDSPAPHAHLEVLESELSVKDGDNDTASTRSISNYGTAKADKGKQRATVEDVTRSESTSDGRASTVSMVAEHSPSKPPIHVASHISTEDIFGTHKVSPISPPSTVGEATPRPAEKEAIAEADDPPLPELEDIPPAPGNNASLTNDIASLLGMFSTVLASHPELSEGVRNVVRNATSGAYWTAHREAVSRAAEEIRRNAEQSAGDVRRAAEEAHKAAEEAAGRRVAEALGSIARAIGSAAGAAPALADNEPVTSTPLNPNPPQNAAGRRPRQGPFGLGRSGTWHHGFFGGRGGQNDPFDPRYDPFFSTMGLLHRPSRSFAPPPPPPPPVHPGPPPSVPPRHGGAFGAGSFPPPPPPGLHGGPFGPGPSPPPPPPPVSAMPGSFPSYDPMSGNHAPRWPPSRPPPEDFMRQWTGSNPDHELDNSMLAGVSPTTAVNADPNASAGAELSSKEALQAAKERYKAEKERYRREREMRKANRSRKLNSSGEEARYAALDSSEDDEGSDADAHNTSPPLKDDIKKEEPNYSFVKGPLDPQDNVASSSSQSGTAEPVTQIVSNARGTFPQFEMFSVSPRRHHTIHGQGARERQRIIPGPPPPLPGPPPPFVAPVPPPPGPPPHMYNPFMAASATSRVTQNITRRLADMGFTSADYQNLSVKVDARVSRLEEARRASGERDVSREMEDAAVAEVLEDLLSQPSKPSTGSTLDTLMSQEFGQPQTSTAGPSTLRRSNTTVPGAWN